MQHIRKFFILYTELRLSHSIKFITWIISLNNGFHVLNENIKTKIKLNFTKAWERLMICRTFIETCIRTFIMISTNQLNVSIVISFKIWNKLYSFVWSIVGYNWDTLKLLNTKSCKSIKIGNTHILWNQGIPPKGEFHAKLKKY